VKRIGVVTIGQVPRTDLVPEIRLLLGEDVEIVEKGALDGLTFEQVMNLSPRLGDEVLVTRMADGTEVTVAESELVPRLKKRIAELEVEGISVILLACTGEFPELCSRALIIQPQRVLFHAVSAVAEGLKLGVLVPNEGQVDSSERRWSAAPVREVFVKAASPYGPLDRIEVAVQGLTRYGVDMVVMDCMGYTRAMKETAYKYIQRPVILARSIVAKVISELI